MPDPELLVAIRREIAESPFIGDGHRKIRARLARRGIHTSGKRVLRLTRGAGLLAPTAQVRKRAKRLHDGKITVDVPDTLWAIDATQGHTRLEVTASTGAVRRLAGALLAVSGMIAPTRNQFDFIAFLDQLDTEIPARRQVIAVLDNLSTHKTQTVEGWLDAHPRWRFVFTLKHASWLNEVEIFFSILARRLLKHSQFTSLEDFAVQMLTFVEHYHLTATPFSFSWTYTGEPLAA
jgi:hypothetical protein